MRRAIIFIILLCTASAERVVVMSFDGGHNLESWEDILTFAESNQMHFTFFLSGVYFIRKLDRRGYVARWGSRLKTNYSMIGWEGYTTNITRRLEYIDRAVAGGHEMGSHAVGHFNGADWTYDEWMRELRYFSNIIDSCTVRYGRTNSKLSMRIIKSFRAPELGRNDDLYRALSDSGYDYDCSSASEHYWCYQQPEMMSYPLVIIKHGTNGGTVLAMDYNFFDLHEECEVISNSNVLRRHEQDMYNTLARHYDTVTNAPMIIGGHFTPMNLGVYWEATKRFLLYAKNKGAVFWTFRQLHTNYKNDRKREGGLYAKRFLIHDR